MIGCCWLRAFLSWSFTYSLRGGCICVSRFGLTSWPSCPDVMPSERAAETCPYNNRKLSSFFQRRPWPSPIRLGLPWPIQVSSTISEQMTLSLSSLLQAWRGVCWLHVETFYTSHPHPPKLWLARGARYFCTTYYINSLLSVALRPGTTPSFLTQFK